MELLGGFLRILALISGGLLLVLTGFTVVDVILRYVFNAPFSGSFEFTEYLMSAIVFLAMSYTGWAGGHVSVDLFEKWLDRPALRFLPAIMALLGSVLFAVIAWQATRETIATIGQFSNMLRWPHYPFRFIVAFGAAMFALVLLIQAIQSLRRLPAGTDR